jgi:hypothetical protein
VLRCRAWLAILLIGFSIGAVFQQVFGVEPEALDGGVNAGPFLVQEFLALTFEEKILCADVDEHAQAAALFDELFVNELLVAFENSEGIDSIFGGDIPDGGESVAFLEDAVEDHGDDMVAELAVDGLGFVEVDRHEGGVIVEYNSDADKEKTARRQELASREEQPKAKVPEPRESERAGAGDWGLKLIRTPTGCCAGRECFAVGEDEIGA